MGVILDLEGKQNYLEYENGLYKDTEQVHISKCKHLSLVSTLMQTLFDLQIKERELDLQS